MVAAGAQASVMAEHVSTRRANRISTLLERPVVTGITQEANGMTT